MSLSVLVLQCESTCWSNRHAKIFSCSDILEMFYFSCGYWMIPKGNSSASEQSEGQFANKSTVLYIVNVFSCTKRSSVPLLLPTSDLSLGGAGSLVSR